MALFCAATRRDPGFLYWFFFLSHVQVLLCENLLVCHLKYPSSKFFTTILIGGLIGLVGRVFANGPGDLVQS